MTCGTWTVPGGGAGVGSGAGGDSFGACVDCGAVSGAGTGGVSFGAWAGCGAVTGAGAGGVSGADGGDVCDTATPAKQVSNISDELLRSSSRLLRTDMLIPPIAFLRTAMP